MASPDQDLAGPLDATCVERSSPRVADVLPENSTAAVGADFEMRLQDLRRDFERRLAGMEDGWRRVEAQLQTVLNATVRLQEQKADAADVVELLNGVDGQLEAKANSADVQQHLESLRRRVLQQKANVAGTGARLADVEQLLAQQQNKPLTDGNHTSVDQTYTVQNSAQSMAHMQKVKTMQSSQSKLLNVAMQVTKEWKAAMPESEDLAALQKTHALALVGGYVSEDGKATPRAMPARRASRRAAEPTSAGTMREGLDPAASIGSGGAAVASALVSDLQLCSTSSRARSLGDLQRRAEIRGNSADRSVVADVTPMRVRRRLPSTPMSSGPTPPKVEEVRQMAIGPPITVGSSSARCPGGCITPGIDKRPATARTSRYSGVSTLFVASPRSCSTDAFNPLHFPSTAAAAPVDAVTAATKRQSAAKKRASSPRIWRPNHA